MAKPATSKYTDEEYELLKVFRRSPVPQYDRPPSSSILIFISVIVGFILGMGLMAWLLG